MPKKPNTRSATNSSLRFPLLVTGALIFIALLSFSSCQNSPRQLATREISSDSLRILLSDTGKVNWLDRPDWRDIEIDAKPEDRVKIDNEMTKIYYYVLGALMEYNEAFKMRIDTPYKIKEFRYAVNPTHPLRFTVVAYLTPPAEKLPEHPHDDEGGPLGHLKPPEPPPPPR